MVAKVERRAIIKFLSKEGAGVVEIHCILLRTFRERDVYTHSSGANELDPARLGVQGFWTTIAPRDRGSITSILKISHSFSKTNFIMFARLPKSWLFFEYGQHHVN
jgi:hypothetical protein